MGVSQATKIALAVSFFGILSFIFGVIAENKKPASGTPIQGKGVVICKFPNDPTIGLGSLSVVTLFLAALAGHVAVYFPYKGKTVPVQALSRSVSLVIFFIIAEVVSGVALGMMLWATITEGLHRSRNVHYNLDTECLTAKTGLFGGAAFLALDASLIWLVCQILTLNARADYLEEDDSKGEYGQVYVTEMETNGAAHPAP
ncbi:uncharacterized protein LOC121984301 isoform X2 [Zingiber officinale]|uniref:Uncharacterized protein n=1 Tax=Zingiber officinale TaxID=94328 RepID=A0A8J5G979_ZINOF|nr:uncharacterized protein LOC121984301 isoform X1 [Zingiber officinale]XP_042393109.1 uncharacterized protein LOC121984301 isoform X2 [Zingiber officinale]KAG6503103.1 hypothetical protein ZIOFF_035393 [Zingiber officinale]